MGASYNPLYHKYLLQKRTLIGCTDVLYPNEYNLTSQCISIRLPAGIMARTYSLFSAMNQLTNSLKGRFEDLVIHVLCNHSLLSCLYSPNSSPISSNGRKLLYIAQNAIAFSLSQILNSMLYYVQLDSIMGASTCLDILIVNPLIISVVSIVTH